MDVIIYCGFTLHGFGNGILRGTNPPKPQMWKMETKQTKAGDSLGED
jgi:hypothetical protein